MCDNETCTCENINSSLTDTDHYTQGKYKICNNKYYKDSLNALSTCALPLCNMETSGLHRFINCSKLGNSFITYKYQYDMVSKISMMHNFHRKQVNSSINIHKIKRLTPICNSFINYDYSTFKLLFINLCILHRYQQSITNTCQNIDLISLLNNRNFKFNVDNYLPIYNLMTIELSKFHRYNTLETNDCLSFTETKSNSISLIDTIIYNNGVHLNIKNRNNHKCILDNGMKGKHIDYLIANINKLTYFLKNDNIQTKDFNCSSQLFSQNDPISTISNEFKVLSSKNNTVIDKDMNKTLTFNTFSYSKKGLHVANINIQHILNKLDEIKYHLAQVNSSHILGLCETFLTERVQNNALFINNFAFERKDRVGKRGGGLLIYIASKGPLYPSP